MPGRQPAGAGAAQGWRVGASVYGQGATESSDGTYHLRQGRYAILGLNAAWQIDSRAELRLNVNNALDKHYYQSIYSDVFGNLAGAPRNLMLTLNYKL